MRVSLTAVKTLSFITICLISAFCLPLASAQTHGVGLEIRSGQNCLDAQADRQADATPIIIHPCHGKENQRWTLTVGEHGPSAIVGPGGYCLDVRGGANAENTPTMLYRCHFGENQLFRLESDGTIREAKSGKCLTPKDAKPYPTVVLDTCSGAANQKWQFER